MHWQTHRENRGGKSPYSISSPSRTTWCTNGTWRARKSLRTNQTFRTRISSVSLEKWHLLVTHNKKRSTKHESHFCWLCHIPFVQEHHLCLEGHQIQQGPEDHKENIWSIVKQHYRHVGGKYLRNKSGLTSGPGSPRGPLAPGTPTGPGGPFSPVDPADPCFPGGP